jgi:hypothetical protein
MLFFYSVNVSTKYLNEMEYILFQVTLPVKVKWTDLDVIIGNASRLCYMYFNSNALGSETGTDRMESRQLLRHKTHVYCLVQFFSNFVSRVPLSQYKTCSRTTNTIRVPLRTANINAYFQDTGLLVGRFEDFEPANQRNNSTAQTSDFSVVTFLI